MCCCNRPNRCCRCGGCSANGNGGAVTLPALDQLARLSGGGSSAGRWPVYISVPAFLMEVEEETDSCGCCCRG